MAKSVYLSEGQLSSEDGPLLVGAGQELLFAERDTTFSTTSTSLVDVPGLSGAITIPDGPFLLYAQLTFLIEEKNIGQAAVSSGSRTTNVVTLNTSAAHGFVPGQIVNVDVSDNTFDGAFVVASVPTSTSLTYSQTAANDATAGTGTVGSAAQPPGDAQVALALSDNTHLQGGLVPRAGNQFGSINLALRIPCADHSPTPGTEVTYKVQVRSTAATSTVDLTADFFGSQFPCFLHAYTLR